MLKIFALSAALTLPGICSYSQNLIGYKYIEIKKYMKENHSEMNLNKVTNTKFSYLKYSDNSDSQTMLFFLSGDSVCRSIRMICDEVKKNQKVKEFNSIYKKKGENNWIDSHNGNDYIIEISNENWYYIITMQPYK
jgi:hypothetical protein